MIRTTIINNSQSCPEPDVNESQNNERYLYKVAEMLEKTANEKKEFMNDSLEFVYYDGRQSNPLRVVSDFTDIVVQEENLFLDIVNINPGAVLYTKVIIIITL